MEMIGQKMAQGQFSYYLYEDAGFTGRLEVTVYKNQKESVEGENGSLVWSKAQSGQAPSSDWDTFIGLIQQALDE